MNRTWGPVYAPEILRMSCESPCIYIYGVCQIKIFIRHVCVCLLKWWNAGVQQSWNWQIYHQAYSILCDWQYCQIYVSIIAYTIQTVLLLLTVWEGSAFFVNIIWTNLWLSQSVHRKLSIQHCIVRARECVLSIGQSTN